MHDRAVEQVSDGGESDVGVRPHVQALPGQELAWSHLIEEDERPDHLLFLRRQGAMHLEAADVVGARDDHRFNLARQRRSCRIARQILAHDLCPSPVQSRTEPIRAGRGMHLIRPGLTGHPIRTGERSRQRSDRGIQQSRPLRAYVHPAKTIAPHKSVIASS